LQPVILVGRLGSRHLQALASDSRYVAAHQRVLRRLRAVVSSRPRPPAGLSWARPIAYFSMEFGVHESLPVYAGGLGILAGDHAKSASDEGVPLVGVGLYYRRGYFRQEMDSSGKQQVIQLPAKTSEQPIEPVLGPSGRELRIPVELPQGVVVLRAWRLQVGRVSVYLLDADVPENRASDRKITHRLYSVARRERIQQELLCGIGGLRLLAALGVDPGAYHLNEGHVAFLTLERLRGLRTGRRLGVDEALEMVASNTVFTTHTPVPEGNEVFDLALAREHLTPYAEAAGLDVDEYLSLGVDHDVDGRPFLSMTVLALRLSRFRNGVSALHGEVSRGMWQHLWPGFRAEDGPIGSITNGVHMPTWVAPEMNALYRTHLGSDWTEHQEDAVYWKKAARISDRDLWDVKQGLKEKLVDFVRARESDRLERLGWSESRRKRAVEGLLDPNALTIGFARRFALYKRADLIFKDLKRIERLLASKARPVQVIFAGKPHPEDPLGRKLCERILALSRQAAFRGRVVLIENYDIEVGQRLVQGVDVWLNNPRRPLEASGTSGQKVPLNGGLNCSILDGWWCEGYSPNVGWAFGRPEPYDDLKLQDREDSQALYRVLEREVIPTYYRRDSAGLPKAWLKMVKAAIADTAVRFSSSHMVLEYARNLYAPAVANGSSVHARGGSRARELVAWKENVFRSWPLVHLRDGQIGKAGRDGALTIEVFLAGISPEALVCRDEAGAQRTVRVLRTSTPGVSRVRIVLPKQKKAASSTLWLYPTHPLLVNPQELGLSLEVHL